MRQNIPTRPDPVPWWRSRWFDLVVAVVLGILMLWWLGPGVLTADAGTPLKTAHYERTQGGAASSDIVILKCESWSVSDTSQYALVTRTSDGEGGIRSVYRCIGP